MLSKVTGFSRLSPSERGVFLRALVLLQVVSVAVRLLGIRKTMTLLIADDSTQAVRKDANPDNSATALCTSVIIQKAMNNSLLRGSCLSRSLVLWYLLRRQGIRAEVCIGLQKAESSYPLDADSLRAHAWVEYAGMVLNDQPGVRQQYVVFEHPSLGN